MTDSPRFRHRVLVVAATRDEADSLRALLTIWDCDVRTAVNGATGLAEAETFLPQVALLDVRVDDLDTYDVARRIRLLPGLGGVTVVALAEHDADRVPAGGECFDHVLSMPVDPEMLRRIVAG